MVYLEVAWSQRLVYDHDSGKDNNPGHFRVTVTFEHQDPRTKLTMRFLFPTAAERKRVVKA